MAAAAAARPGVKHSSTTIITGGPAPRNTCAHPSLAPAIFSPSGARVTRAQIASFPNAPTLARVIHDSADACAANERRLCTGALDVT